MIFVVVASKQDALEQQRSKLLASDQYAWIDLAFVAHVASAGGQEALEDLFLSSCLPSSGLLLSLPFCLQESKKLQESDLYLFSSSGAQGSVAGAHALLNRVDQGLPVYLDSQSTPFLQKVYCQIQHFVVHAEKGTIKHDDKEILVRKASMGEVISGAAALKKMWQDIEGKEPSNLTLKALEPMVVHGCLLSEKDRKQVHAKVEEVLKISQGQSKAVKATACAKASDAKPSKRKAASAHAEGEAAKAAKSLFS